MEAAGKKRVAAILAVDMAGYSAEAERDAASAAAAAKALHARVRAAAEARGGRVFSTAGDGLMCEFPAASEAVAAAADMLAAQPSSAPPIRIGVHLGEAFEHEGGDLLGHGVNVAARLEALAQPGAALISRAAAEMVQGDLRSQLTPVGKVALDKMNETIEAFALDPAAAPGKARPPRRKRAQMVIAALAGAAVLIALVAMLNSTRRPEHTGVDAVAQEVMARLATEAEHSPGDSSLSAVAALAASREPNARAAFAFLRAGEIDQAVTTLERFGADLSLRGVKDEAANAYLRAALVAGFLDPQRALDNARRAVNADPNSKAAVQELLTMTRARDGYQAARRAAREIIAKERAPSPIRAFAYAMIVLLADQWAWDQDAARALEALNREAPRFADDEYLQATAAFARGGAAVWTRAPLAEAARHYDDAYARFQRIPGSEWRGQHGLILAAIASGDVERVWTLGRNFVAERERQGWPPEPDMLRLNCIEGALLLGLLDEARPYCVAAANNQRNVVAAWQAKLILSLEERRLEDTDREAAALRTLLPSLAPDQRAFAQEVLDYVTMYAGLLRGQLGAADRAMNAKRTALLRAGRIEESAQVLILAARIDLAMGRKERACPRLAEAAQVYTSYGADPGALFTERFARQAGC
ncbi:MAG: adenylate/guanylate cyclase domain-containing protein [Terricaulis sp.]|nr:adenylate/guanylate cyclase domain-containing protein [Terricaulis sp.]